MKTAKQKNVIIYARVACEEQGAGSEQAYQEQLQSCRDYCEKNELNVVMEMRVFGPAAIEQSNGLLEYVEKVGTKEYALYGIVVTDYTRISRNQTELTTFKRGLKRLKLNLYQVDESLVSSLVDGSGAAHSEALGRAVKAGIARKKEMVEFSAKGKNGKPYRYTEERPVIQKTKARRAQ